MPDERQRASRLEILGAWLHLWTAPRDVFVPPVPWRKVVAVAVAVALLGVFTALVIAPAIDDAKDDSAAEERRALADRAAARRARVREEQRAVTGTLPKLAPQSLSDIERRIGLDAQRRFGTSGRAAECEPAPGTDLSGTRTVYDCSVTVREIVGAGDQEGARGALVVPYRAIIDFGTERFAFCKTNPLPGEAAVADPRDVVELPAACRASS